MNDDAMQSKTHISKLHFTGVSTIPISVVFLAEMAKLEKRSPKNVFQRKINLTCTFFHVSLGHCSFLPAYHKTCSYFQDHSSEVVYFCLLFCVHDVLP